MQERIDKPIRRPEWIAVKGFLAVILVGTALLMLPAAAWSGRWTPPLTALFTATSATCVTGLSVVDIGTHFSRFGQLVILALIQVGGLGIMTLGTFLLVLIGRRLRLRDEFMVRTALGVEGVRGLGSLLRAALTFTFAIEFVGGAVLTHRYLYAHGYTPGEAVYAGFFHAISAFCNAGFALHADSLIGLRSDSATILTVAALVVMGGLGFLVLYNIAGLRPWRRDRLGRGSLSLHTRLVLVVTGALILIGFAGFLALEWRQTLDGLPFGERLVCALFQAITPRTAGFNVVDIAALKPATEFLTLLMMFIGGSPASTAGGIKTTTIAVLFLTLRGITSGSDCTRCGMRTVPVRVVREAISILLLSLWIVTLLFGALLVTEHVPLLASGLSTADELLFESVSAIATVGLSTGITPSLSAFGQVCLILGMFVGRLGPLTIAVSVGRQSETRLARYPEEEVIVG